jgi:histone H3/H4
VDIVFVFFFRKTLVHTHTQGKKKGMTFVVCPTTMKRIIKHKTGFSRIERAAAVALCRSTDAWVGKIVKRIVAIATDNNKRTIDSDTVLHALDGQVKVVQSTSAREWCKTRMRDRLKALSPDFRWSLAGECVLYKGFESYLQLLCERIASTQRLAGRRTMSEQHVVEVRKNKQTIIEWLRKFLY